MTGTINHVLPGEDGGDTRWFYRQNIFERQEILRQVAFKRRHWPELGNGKFAKRPQHTYPHILPDGNERKAFNDPIADEIFDYLEDSDIALHTEALNLKSSQVACFNFLFPLRLDLSFATRVLNPLIPGLEEVTGIEFEYTGPNGTTEWLGEPPGGKRGQNRTSIDAAIFWNDGKLQRHATLVEWKYTEHNFGVCSAYSNGKKEEKDICRSLNVAKEDNPAVYCLLTSGKRHRSRRYWEHLKDAGVSLQAFSEVSGCPFQGPLYQLMRQFLLGTFMVKSNTVDRFEVVSMDFGENLTLHRVPRHLQSMVQREKGSVIDLWNSALNVDNKVRHITVEEFIQSVDDDEIKDTHWRDYILERYGV